MRRNPASPLSLTVRGLSFGDTMTTQNHPAARKAMSKSLRFSVFERDGFTCQYCGEQPPSVVLHIDHILPVSKGGTNDPENLRTSCAACNGGKGAKDIGADANPIDRLRRAQEAQEAIAGAKVFQKVAEARAKMRQTVCEQVCELIGKSECQKATITTICCAIDDFSASDVDRWLAYAASVTGRGCCPVENVLIRYFCGMLKNKRAGQ